MTLDPKALAEVAAAAAREGAAALEPFLRRLPEMAVREKGVHDFVTDADLAAEAAIRGRILGGFPGHRFLGEETEGAGEGPGEERVNLDLWEPTWIIDPLDGTTNFIHANPTFGVSVACAAEGRLLAAATYDPSREELFRAARGAGASLNGRPLSVSPRRSLEGCLIGTGFPFRRLHHLDPYLEIFRRVLPRVAGIRRPGAATLDLAWVAAGRLDGFWEEGLGPWDIAAGALLIEEAGGLVTDFEGAGRYLDSGEVVAGAPGVQPALRALISMG